MKPELIPYLLALIAVAVGFAWLAVHLWRDGVKTLPSVLLVATLIVAGMCFLIGEGTRGFLGGLGWVLTAILLLLGPAAGLFVGIVLGMILGPLKAPPEEPGK